MMGHDSYEFMGRLYLHQATDWLRGEPWYFYLVLLGTKLPLLSLVAFVGGLGVLLRRETGDGRYFLLLWLVLWAMSFMFVGGKFTRYITSVLPAIFMTAAVGLPLSARTFGRISARLCATASI